MDGRAAKLEKAQADFDKLDAELQKQLGLTVGPGYRPHMPEL
jgi:hypothetical protein